MKKYVFIGLFLLIFADTSFAFIDTVISGTLSSINAAYEKAYKEFMKVEVIKQTTNMVKNYNESKNFYARMDNISKHKGGVGGYVRDELKNGIDNANKRT